MRSKLWSLVIAGAALASLVCAARGSSRAPGDVTRLCYATADGQQVRSTLVATRARGAADRFANLTELGSGAQVREEATIDGTGRLVSARLTLEPGAGKAATRVVLDPARGSVEVTTPTLRASWKVPNDLPWVWAPLLTEPSAGGPIVTPLDAEVAFRAAAGGMPIRLLDLGTLTSNTVLADQIVVLDGSGATVIAGDDAIEIEAGLPRSLRLAAVGATLEAVDPRKHSDTLAAAVACRSPNRSFLP